MRRCLINMRGGHYAGGTSSIAEVDLPSGLVLVNCQLVGGAHEGQPGFTLVFVKAVLLHQWVQSAGLFLSQSNWAKCSAPRRVQQRSWRLKRRAMCTSMFFSITPLPLRTGASLRPMERRSEEGIKCQLSIRSEEHT